MEEPIFETKDFYTKLSKFENELIENMEYLKIYSNDKKKKARTRQVIWSVLQTCQKIKEITRDEDPSINEKIIFAYQCEEFILKHFSN